MISAAVAAGDTASADQYNNLRKDATGASSLLPHQQTVPVLTLKIESGVFYVGATRVKYAGGNTPSIAAPAANPRIDLVTIDSAGTVALVAGAEAGSPSVPTYPANKVIICEVFCRVGQTQIFDTDQGSNGYISADVRPFVTPVIINSDAQIINTSSVVYQSGAPIYGASAAGTDAYAITPTPAIAAYAAGQRFLIKADVANSGAATASVSGLSNVSIKKNGSVTLDDGDIPAGGLFMIGYDGTNFQLLSPIANSSGKFGGTSSDGALTITSGTTTVSFASASFVQLNYSSISITGTGVLGFSNPGTNGTTLALKSKGNVTLTSSATPMIDMSGMGAAGGTGGTTGAPTPGTASEGLGILDSSTHKGTSGALDQATIAAGGVIYVLTGAGTLYTTQAGQVQTKMVMVVPGSGGGGGAGTSGGSAGGAGGRGGGALYIECGGALNFTTTSGISVSGLTGVAGAAGTSGNAGGGSGGGGGAGGQCVILANVITAATGTVTNTGGNGGAGGSRHTSGNGASNGAGAGAGGYNAAGGVGGRGRTIGNNGEAGTTAAGTGGGTGGAAGTGSGANSAGGSGGGGGAGGVAAVITTNTVFQ